MPLVKDKADHMEDLEKVVDLVHGGKMAAEVFKSKDVNDPLVSLILC